MINKLIVQTCLVLSSLFFACQAHAFLVSDFDGKRIDLQDHVGDGRWTVVMLWQLDCVPCEQQKPAIEAFHKKYKSTFAHVVGLVIDGHEYMPSIKSFVDKKPTAFPSYVVFGDVFRDQIFKETGKHFPAAPGYLVYAPDGELKLKLNSRIDVNNLIAHLESQFGS